MPNQKMFQIKLQTVTKSVSYTIHILLYEPFLRKKLKSDLIWYFLNSDTESKSGISKVSLEFSY